MSDVGFLILNSFLMLLATLLIYFLVKEYLRIKNNNFTFKELFITGFFIVGFLILNEIFIRDFLVSNYSVSISLVIIPIFILFINRNYFLISLGATATGYIVWFLDNTQLENLIPLIEITLVSIIVYLLSFNKTFLSQNYGTKLFVTFWIIIITNSLTTIFSFIWINIISFTAIYYSLLYYGLSFLFIALSILVIEKIYTQFNENESFTMVDSISYYKLSLAKEELMSIIQTSNYSYGALVLFDLRKHTLGDKKLELILMKLRVSIIQKYLDAFFFRASTNFYAVFIPMKEKDIDMELMIKNNKTNKVCKTYLYNLEKILIKNSNKREKILGFVSLYGINSNDINELIDQAEFLSTPKIIKNNFSYLILYDYRRLHKAFKIKAELQSLSKYTGDFKISYVKSVFDDKIFYPIIEYSKEKKIFNYRKRELTNYQHQLLIRFFAHKIILNFDYWNNSKIVVHFLISIVSQSTFDAKEFIKKIKVYGNINNVILTFEKDKLNNQFKKNISFLKEKGIKTALILKQNTTNKYLNSFKPDYVLQDFYFEKRNILYKKPIKRKVKFINYSIKEI